MSYQLPPEPRRARAIFDSSVRAPVLQALAEGRAVVLRDVYELPNGARLIEITIDPALSAAAAAQKGA